MQYEPIYESVSQHVVPNWFHDAKFGIFVHWGLYSVPGYAPIAGEFDQVLESGDWQSWFAQNPYAEWYMNSYQIDGSPTQQFHRDEYGEDFDYAQFASHFNDAVKRWDPNVWARLFAQIKARYVVLTTKHHDGFLLWPSAQPNPSIEGYHAERDLVGEMSAAVRSHGMTMGLYYSGGLDWTFNDKVIQDSADVAAAIPQSDEYVNYANAHWRELIQHYAPTILWNDIGYPANTNLNALFADYYNQFPTGVINNRFNQYTKGRDENDNFYDFETPEYTSFGEIRATKWESCRGIGASFGYNRNEGPEQYKSVTDLVRSLVDIVSKNGNLLLNVGPMADGTIPDLQRDRLLGIGRWLRVNGEAIFDTRPWTTAEGSTQSGIDVRFTQKGDCVYATLLDTPDAGQIRINDLTAAPNSTIRLLGHDGALAWEPKKNGLAITLPDSLPDAPAHALEIKPQPRL